MYQISALLRLRSISAKPQLILRTVQCRSLHLLNRTQHWSVSHLSRPSALHAGRVMCVQTETSKVEPYISGRCFVTQPVNSEDGVLIYSGSLGKSVIRVKILSYSTSAVSLYMLYLMLMKMGFQINSFAQMMTCFGYLFFTFLTPVLLHLVTKCYVLRLYHNNGTDMYTAVTYNVFLGEKKTRFHQSDVRVPDVSKMLTTFYGGRHSMLVNPQHFESPQDFNHLMGYDRPFSFDTDHFKKPDKY